MTVPTLDHAHALIIGVANYKDSSISDLPEVANDVQAIHAVLIDPQVAAYPPDQVKLLLNEQASASAIRAAFAALADACKPEATALIYISSHGHALPNGEYLIPYDADNSSESALIGSAIQDAEVKAMLSAIQADRVVVILDCCHAGGITKAMDTPKAFTGVNESFAKQLGIGKGRAVFASSRSDQKSYILPGDSNSLFTKYILEGLRGGANHDGGLIRIFDLWDYVQPRVHAAKPQQIRFLAQNWKRTSPLRPTQSPNRLPARLSDCRAQPIALPMMPSSAINSTLTKIGRGWKAR